MIKTTKTNAEMPQTIFVKGQVSADNYEACGYGCKVTRSGREIPAKVGLHNPTKQAGGILGYCVECNRNSKVN